MQPPCRQPDADPVVEEYFQTSRYSSPTGFEQKRVLVAGCLAHAHKISAHVNLVTVRRTLAAQFCFCADTLTGIFAIMSCISDICCYHNTF
jgi:hypothetical protein